MAKSALKTARFPLENASEKRVLMHLISPCAQAGAAGGSTRAAPCECAAKSNANSGGPGTKRTDRARNRH
eukprot:2886608-Rhodomonas_salina.1